MFVLDGTSQDSHTANTVEVLSAINITPEMIIVGIPNSDRNRDLTPHYLYRGFEDEDSTKGAGDNFLSFMEKELIPFVDEKYRTTNYKMLAGHSRGGLFALYALLEKPDLFDAYFCYSPAFWREDNLIVKKAGSFFNSRDSLDTFLYMSLGTNENEKMEKGFEAMVEILKGLNVKSLETHHDYTRNADHQTNAYYSTPVALKEWAVTQKEVSQQKAPAPKN